MLEQMIKDLESNKNQLITGGAGVGKSYNLRGLIEYCDENNINAARSALTGMASLQFEFGETMHRLFGIGHKTKVSDLKDVINSYKFSRETRWELQALDVIIVDEVSMYRSDTLELCNAIMQYVCQNKKPFGGKTVIFSGDFMQLPPIVRPEEKPDFKERGEWCFQSPIWEELDLKINYLTEIKRQDEPKFAMALNMIRAGATNEAVNEYFSNTATNEFSKEVVPVKLLSTNYEVDRVNAFFLSKIKSEKIEKKATIDGINDKFKDQIKRNCPAVEDLELKLGAQVMILVNSQNYEYVNGSMGEFLGFTKVVVRFLEMDKTVLAAKVKLLKCGTIVTLPQYEWKIEKNNDGKVTRLASFKQYPIKLGWAITIHKSQGMSLDFLEVDLMRCFAEGMAYVALSRARTYEGLRVINYRPGAVRCNKHAFNFYMNLKNKGAI